MKKVFKLKHDDDDVEAKCEVAVEDESCRQCTKVESAVETMLTVNQSGLLLLADDFNSPVACNEAKLRPKNQNFFGIAVFLLS